MTREEAIKELKQFSGTTRLKLSANFWTALNTAINALEQEPKTKDFDILHFVADNACLSTFEAIEKAYNMGLSEQEPCEDAISRQAVLDLPRIKTHNVWGNIIKESVDVENVRQLPSVTQQPKTGDWERVTDKQGYLVWECDKCGWQQRFATNFCPDCGAKMAES